MTPFLSASLVATGIFLSYGAIVAGEILVARITSSPSRIERAAMVYARALAYELRQQFRDLMREEINEALDERERRRGK